MEDDRTTFLFFFSIFLLVRLTSSCAPKSASYVPWKWSKSLWVEGWGGVADTKYLDHSTQICWIWLCLNFKLRLSWITCCKVLNVTYKNENVQSQYHTNSLCFKNLKVTKISMLQNWKISILYYKTPCYKILLILQNLIVKKISMLKLNVAKC